MIDEKSEHFALLHVVLLLCISVGRVVALVMDKPQNFLCMGILNKIVDGFDRLQILITDFKASIYLWARAPFECFSSFSVDWFRVLLPWDARSAIVLRLWWVVVFSTHRHGEIHNLRVG